MKSIKPGEQQRKASGLNLVLAAISLWNTVYLQKAMQALADAGNPVPEEVIPTPFAAGLGTHHAHGFLPLEEIPQ